MDEKIKYYDELNNLQKLPNDQFINKDTYVNDALKCLEYFDSIGERNKITSSKIRSLYGMLCDIIADENDRNGNTLENDTLAALKLLRVRIIYDMGRDESVKLFMKNTHLIAYLYDIENMKSPSREKFDLFCKYFEALVAFHRYMNPKEN